MYVRDLMSDSPMTCFVHESASEAARIMWERDCGAVPIVDQNRRVVGMVTDRDICMGAYFQGRPLSAIPLSTVMSRDVCTCQAGEELGDAERRMRERQIRRLPVVSADGMIEGILSLSDVARGVKRNGGMKQNSGDGQALLQTVAAISEPRGQASV